MGGCILRKKRRLSIKNNKNFIFHRKGIDLYLIDLTSGAIEWINQIEQPYEQMVVKKSQAILYEKKLGEILIKNIQYLK